MEISHNLLTFLLNALWQVPLVALVAMLVCRIIRDGPASQGHAVWVAALITAVLLPLTTVLPHQQSPLLRVAVSFAPVALAPPDLAAAPVRPDPASEWRIVALPHTVATLGLAAYVVFALVRLGCIVLAWLRTVQIRRTAKISTTPSAALERVWAHCLEVLGLEGVELRSSAHIPSPVTTGRLSKTVILPDSLLVETSEDVLTTAVGHEMGHIARNDFALSLVYEVLYAPISFHPAAWIIRRGIERTREMACDELVIRKLLDPAVYAQSIVSIAVRMTGLPRPGYTLGVFDGDFLEERIRRLVARPAVKLKRTKLLFAAGLSALALCAVIASALPLTERTRSGLQTEMRPAGDAYANGDFKPTRSFPLLASEKRVASASPPPRSGSPFPLVGQYWQVMGRDEMLAADLFRQLRAKGFPAAMHDSPVDHKVRTVAGPYLDPHSLDQARTALEAAGFRPIRMW